MAVIDDLIVAMQFDNSKFEAAVKVSVATLTHLKSTLNFGTSPNGIDAAQKSIDGFQAGNMTSQIEGASAKFIALSTIAITALSRITDKVIDTGTSIAKMLTIDPVSDGFAEYELKMGSIQTILANTSKDYATHDAALKDVTSSLDELNTYADLTIYNFGDMTKNIGLFTNAGIGVKDATAMIKGFSNEAAASGTTSQGAAGAAYQLSQALSAGVITLMDWKSLTNVGMGNANMKDGIIQIAEAMGAFEGTAMTAEEAAKDFNGSLEKRWLSADVMENYLKIQAEGNEEVSRSMMKQIGLSDKQADAFIKQQKVAQDAATKVRTWTQFVDTLKEGVGSSWSQTFDILLGDFDAATTLFTGISEGLGDIISSFGNARNELLQGWADLGGRDKLIEGLKNVAQGLLGVLRPIKDAFSQIFPPATAQSLMSLTEAFHRFSERLKVSGETADKIRRTFAGVFAIFGIGWTIVKSIFSVFAQLFGALSGGSGGVLSLTASLGDFLVKIHETLANSEGFKNFFVMIGTILAVPIKMIGAIGGGIAALLGHFGDLGGVISQVYGILAKGDFRGGPFDEDSKIVDVLFKIREGIEWVTGAMSQFWNVMTKGDFVGGGPFEEDSPLISGLFKFRDMLSNFFTPGNISMLLGAGAVGALAFGLSKVVKGAIDRFTGEDGGIFGELKDAFTSIKDAFDNVGGVFEKLSSSLTVMQTNVKADIILKIAIAVGVLALSMKLLSTMDVGSLVKSMTAITTSMGLLVGALAIISKIAGAPGIVQMPIIALGLMGLAAAVLILAAAMKVMASMSWEELGKGLVATAALIGMLVAASYGLGQASGPMLRAGIAMIPMAAGIRLLVMSVEAMGRIPLGDLAKGLGGLAGMMVILAASMNVMPKNLPAIGLGLVLVGGGLTIISSAIARIGSMDTGVLVKGLVGIGGALVIVAGALHLMPKNMAMMGVGLTLVAGALMGISSVMQSMGGMSWGELAKGMVGLAGSLIILGVGLNAIQGAMGGAIALGIAAIGLTALLIPITAMANMSWQELLMGLGGLAGVLVIIGAAGYILGPVVPVIVALGIGMAALGIGLLAVGAAALVFGMALKMLFEVVMLGQTAMTAVLTFIPRLATAFANAIASFIVAIANNSGAILGALKELISGLLDVVIELVPKIGEVISTLLTTVVNLIIEHAPQVGEAFKTLVRTLIDVVTELGPEILNGMFELMIGFLNVIRDRIPEVVTAATDIIVAFINAVSDNLPRIVQAGVDLIVDFLNGLAQGIRDNTPRVVAAAKEVGKAIVDGIAYAIKDGVGTVVQAAKDLASGALKAAQNALGIHSPSRRFYEVGENVVDGFVNGIESKDTLAAKTANKFATGFTAGFSKGLGKEMPKVLDEFFKILESGTEDAIISTAAMEGGMNSLSGAIWQAELAMAEFHGEVNRADPESVEKYVEKAGGKLKYLQGVLEGVKAAANEAFGQLAEGKGLDEVLGSEAFLGTILDAGLSIGSMFGIEGMLITAGIKLGLAVVDGLLSVFMGPGTTLLGTIGEWITKLVRAVGGWFGIKFPVKEELKESDKALQDFMATVDDGNERYEKMTEEAVKGLTDRMNEADDLSKGIEDPKITPILDLNHWNKQFNDFLDSLDVGPVVLNRIINGASNFFEDTISNLKGIFSPKSQEQPAQTIIELNQTNTSPKALDHVEIYKQTKSQLSLAKEALNIT
ncbi:tail length tape measure protein [Gordonia phage Secretariat]|uniref:Tape measure protein n=1 Tax=Gordonia phage Secretariat TaxID=2725616 RepID=A0A6M3SWV2_9CAUD|nr:tail length tape measure protein [Gordonia phage Secretariat]QJD49608.1 tape measure protein [Gordonia phage Secretariat]